MNDRFVRLAFVCFVFASLGTIEGFEGKTFLSRTSNDAKTTDEFVAPSDGSVFLAPTFTYAEWIKLDPEKTWLNVDILKGESATKENNDVEAGVSDSKVSGAKNASNDEAKNARSDADVDNLTKTAKTQGSAAETDETESKESKRKDVQKSKIEEKTTENVVLSDDAELSDDAPSEGAEKEEKLEAEKAEESKKNESEDKDVEKDEKEFEDEATNSKKNDEEEALNSEDERNGSEKTKDEDDLDADERIDDDTLCSIKRPKLTRRGERIEGAFILQTCQRAVLVWNGRVNDQGEELLIVESDEYAKVKENDVVLGILPLPGKPLEITRAGDDFHALRNATISKIQEITKPGKIAYEDDKTKQSKFPSYCVLVVECDNIVMFEDLVEAKLCEIFGDVRLSLSDSEKETLKIYSERGIRYFALDVAEIAGNEDARKAPLAFRFKSDKLYYPMQAAKIGAQDFLALEMIVLTPKKIVWTNGSWLEPEKQKKSRVFVDAMGKTTVGFRIEELKEAAPIVAKFCEETQISELTSRDLVVRGSADRFSGDLIMTNAE